MLRLLVFGKNGQIGWELERSLCVLGQVTAFDRRDLDLLQCDLIEECIKQSKPDIIVNASAYTNVDEAESKESLAFAVNAAAPRSMARGASTVGALLVHYSTDYVFDGSKQGAWTEHDDPSPLNVYGRSKLAGEHEIQGSGCDYLLLRTSWIYSARGQNFLLAILRRALNGDTLKVVDDQFGAPTSARFVAEATCQVLAKVAHIREKECARAFREIINIACAGTTTWYGFASRAIEELEKYSDGQRAYVERTSTALLGRAAQRPRNSTLSLNRLTDHWGGHAPSWEKACELVVAEAMQPGRFT